MEEMKKPLSHGEPAASISADEAPPAPLRIKKRFNFWSAVGIAVCTSGAWEGWSASIAQGLTGGGSVGLLWGWVFVSAGIVCMSLALAEFVSRWPFAGGQYVWAANLAPPRYSRVFSWFTAWASMAGLWIGTLSCGMGVAVQVQSYAAIASDYNPRAWHAFLICIAVTAVWILVNIFAADALHHVNMITLAIHVSAYAAIIAVLAATAPHKHDAKYVFTHFENQTGWDSDFVSWSVSLLSALYAFFSLDSASHFCEELERANVLVPRAMVLQAVGSSLMTFPLIITVLFCIGDANAVLASPIGYTSPFTQIILNSTGSVPAAIILNSVSSFVAWLAGCDLTGATARLLWSLARDNGLPSVFAQLHPRWKVPVWANLVLIIPSILVYMIYIWNTTAFYGIMAGVLVAFQISYVVPIGLNITYYAWTDRNVKGPFSLGRFSYPCQVAAFIFGCFMIIMMSLPVYQPVTAASMNYASALVGIVLVGAIFSWFLYGKTHYLGPTFTDSQLATLDHTG